KLPTVIEGGPGIDDIQGGGGNDEIWGGCVGLNPSCNGFKDSLYGRDGNDSLHGGAATDHLDGGAGDDLLDGGPGHAFMYGADGHDIADYSDRAGQSVIASLDGVANDGFPGENDLIGSDVEGIQGGAGNDTLYGNFLNSSTLKGGPGNDTLVG